MPHNNTAANEVNTAYTTYKHCFISITIMPVDVRVADDGFVEYSDAPERQADHEPEQVCRICYAPLDIDTVTEDCTGPVIPDDISGIIDTRPEEG